PGGAAPGAQRAIAMRVDSAQLEEVLFGRDGAAEGLSIVNLAIDMSTIAPSASRSIAKRLKDERGAAFLDAPVTGSRPRAEDGTLTIMVGGEPADFERAQPVFHALGELVVHVCPLGHGSMVKLINNTLAAVNAEVLAEALVVAQRAELDLDALMTVVAAGSGASAMLDLKAQPMLERDLDPLFKLEHMLKDVRHFLEEARALGVGTPVAERAAAVYEKADQRGLGGRDFAAVVEIVENPSAPAGGPPEPPSPASVRTPRGFRPWKP